METQRRQLAEGALVEQGLALEGLPPFLNVQGLQNQQTTHRVLQPCVGDVLALEAFTGGSNLVGQYQMSLHNQQQ